MVPIALTVDGPLNLSDASTSTWAAVTALAMFSTAIAYVLYFKTLERAGAINVLLGSVFLNESLEIIHFIGMLLIAVGLSAIDGRVWQRVRPMKNNLSQ